MLGKPLGASITPHYFCGQHIVKLPGDDEHVLRGRQGEVESSVIALLRGSGDSYTREYLGDGIQINVLDKQDKAVAKILKK